MCIRKGKVVELSGIEYVHEARKEKRTEETFMTWDTEPLNH